MEVTGKRPAYSEDWETGIYCDPCLIDDVNETAQFYCTNCDEFLCDTCARNHRKSKALRQHQLLDRDEMPRKKISNVHDKFCAKHNEKLTEYFCDKHDLFCCSVCVTLDHGQCGVKYIDDLAKGFSSSQEYKSLLKQIKDIEKQIAEDKAKKKNDSTDVSICFRQLKSDIETFRSEINSKIDALENELMQQAEQIQNEDMKAFESVDTLYDKFLVEISDISSALGLLEKCKQNQSLFIAANKAQTQVKEYIDKAQHMLQENIVRKYAFSRNEDIMNTLNLHRKLGSLEMNNEEDRRSTQGEQTEKNLIKEANPPMIGTISIESQEEIGKEQKIQKEEQTIKFLKKIDMDHTADTEYACITGSVLMSNDILAVADSDNKSIKIFDIPSSTIICDITLDDKPWDITYMDLETLVVTCDKHLVFLRFERKSGLISYYRTLTLVKKVPMESGCKGITHIKGTLFVTFVGGSPSVKVVNLEGKVLQTFKHNNEGQNLFSCPEYVTANKDGDTIYVSDSGQDTVISLSMDGKVCNIYKHGSLIGPAGLALGGGDSIYVVGCVSQNIHQITPTCTPVRIVLERKDGLLGLRTVLYNSKDKTIYVSNDCSTSGDRFSIYKLDT